MPHDSLATPNRQYHYLKNASLQDNLQFFPNQQKPHSHSEKVVGGNTPQRPPSYCESLGQSKPASC